jgi:hypothetical protein
VSEFQQQKARFSTMRIVAGITIDTKPLPLNASSGMTLSLRLGVNCEFDSNVTDENEPQPEKHHEPRISTLLGITID